MGALRIQSFRRLLGSFAANQFAWSIANLALSLLVFRRTGSAWASTGFFLAAEFLPAFVAPRLVVSFERFSPRYVLAGAYAFEAVLFALLAGAPSHFSLVGVLVLVFGAGILSLVARPFMGAATVHALSPAGLLREGNAALNGAFAASLLGGPLLASAVISALGSTACILVVAALFVSMALQILRTPGLPESPPERPASEGRLGAALRHASTDPTLRRLFGFQAIVLVFFSLAIPIEVVLAERALHAGAAGYGALLAAWGTGALLGSIGYARWHRVPGWTMVAFGSLCIGVAYLVMGVADQIWLAVVGAAIGGVGNGTEIVAERTALQEYADAEWMTLMLSFNESIIQAMPGLGFLLGGAVASAGGPRLAFVVGGIGSLAAAFAAPVMLRFSVGVPVEARGQARRSGLRRTDESLEI